MTEISSSFTTTYPIQNSYQVTALPISVSLHNGTVSPTPVEEEEYTIKCICGFNDDDGNTVYCEKCDTWQHIDCYYHGEKVPEVHYCTECAPLGTTFTIDADKARERQRRTRDIVENDNGGDRKIKRPSAKGQKKKHRDTITNANLEQINGFSNHPRQDSLTNGKDQPPPAKKAKTGHRPSGSLASINGESRKRAYSSLQSYPSPSKSPQDLHKFPHIPYYTQELVELAKKDRGDQSRKNNELTIQGSLFLTQLRNNPLMVANSMNSPQADKALFFRLDHELKDKEFPPVAINTVNTHVLGGGFDDNGLPIVLKFLRAETELPKNTIVGEIRGQISTLEEYCQETTHPNRWKELSHPDPFVFFHPHMDICIDSRESGTSMRYIRRSCDPNVTIKTFITPDNELHHCFVARRDIDKDAELTITWYLPPRIQGMDMLAPDEKEQRGPETCEYFSRLLANFGDCACKSSKCPLAKFDIRAPNPNQTSKYDGQYGGSGGSARKKVKITKTKAASPAGTGRAATSRAGSEAVRGQNDDDQDRKSTSVSTGRRSGSRDPTPQTGALLDEPPILPDGELTSREQKKIEALERAQKQRSVTEKRKKRANAVTAVKAAKEANDSRKNSGSPLPNLPLPTKDHINFAMPAKPIVRRTRPVYAERGVQTDPEPVPEPLPVDRSRRRLTQHEILTRKVQAHMRKYGWGRNQSSSSSASATNNDVEMKDATTSISNSPATNKSSPVLDSPTADMSTAPLPSQAAHSQPVHGLFKVPALKPSLSSLPPVPPFSASTSSPAPLSSPLAIVQPSPVKKKLSLGDYMSRRKESATPTSEKPAIQFPDGDKPDSEVLHRSSDAARSDVSGIDAMKLKAAENEQAVEDTPMPDADEKNASASSASAEVQSVLSSLQTMQSKQDV